MKNPFKKGTWYYEIQILMFVIMWKHDLSHKPAGEHNSLLSWGRLYIWYDSAWRFHGKIGELRFFLYSLTKNSDKFKNPKAKFRVIWINAKHMFQHWALEFPIVDSLLSLTNYIRLHKAGFRITRSSNEDWSTDMYRFWWSTRIIKDMADIDRVGDYFNTMFNGHSEQLGDRPNIQNYTPEEITDMLEHWNNFNGFTGETCGGCKRSANVFAFGPGWLCNCGHYNVQSWTSVQICHEKPQMGPNLKAIKLGFEKSKKHQALLESLTHKPHPFFNKEYHYLQSNDDSDK